MAGITGLGTTFNLPNYHGELIAVTPTDTPLLSMAGGLNGGGLQADGKKFEWQTEDLRAPEIRPRTEGASAPSGESRVRANVENVCQIFHESVETSYTKQAATGTFENGNAAAGQTPAFNEHTHQVMNALKTIGRDVNYAMWHSLYHSPADNTTARRMRGILQAAGNRSGTVVGPLTTGASDIINETATALANGDKIVFVTPPAELRADTVYYVVNKATDSFKVALTSGGTAITLDSGQTGISYVKSATSLTVDVVEAFMQQVFDNGGISEQGTATLFVSSRQKRALTAAYASEYGKADPFAGTRNVGGLNVQTLETNFGTLNVVTERALAPDTLAVVSMEQVTPVFLAIPGKGVLFEEALAKTGSADRSQIYGEIGLKYGNALTHGVIRGLAV